LSIDDWLIQKVVSTATLEETAKTVVSAFGRAGSPLKDQSGLAKGVDETIFESALDR
jgi:hypothetical protein